MDRIKHVLSGPTDSRRLVSGFCARLEAMLAAYTRPLLWGHAWTVPQTRADGTDCLLDLKADRQWGKKLQ